MSPSTHHPEGTTSQVTPSREMRASSQETQGSLIPSRSLLSLLISRIIYVPSLLFLHAVLWFHNGPFPLTSANARLFGPLGLQLYSMLTVFIAVISPLDSDGPRPWLGSLVFILSSFGQIMCALVDPSAPLSSPIHGTLTVFLSFLITAAILILWILTIHGNFSNSPNTLHFTALIAKFFAWLYVLITSWPKQRNTLKPPTIPIQMVKNRPNPDFP